MAVEFQPERGPITADLPSIPADCIDPNTSLAAYHWRPEFDEAQKSGGQCRVRHAAAIDVRELLSVGEAILPVPGPYGGATGGEAIEEPQEAEGAGDESAPQPTAEPEAIPDLDGKSKDELLAIAGDLGLRGLSVKRKAEIVEAIKAATQE